VKRTPTTTSDSQILAVLHRTGRTWRALVATIKNGHPEAIAAREFTVDRISRLDEWLDEQNAGAVLCVLPAGSVICRTFALPDAPAEQLEQALRLQAEAHLLGIAPPHRLCMAVLPGAPSETTRTGLVLAWPESAMFPVPPTKRRIELIPDVGAIAALLNGHRPNDAIMYLDREDGSVAMAVAHSAGAIFRATREDSASTDDWQRRIGRIAAETALSVGHTGSFVEALTNDSQHKAAELRASEAKLFMPDEIMAAASARAKGLGTDANWWAQYGIAAGAMLARLEAGSLAALTRLQESPPVETPSTVLAVAQKLSRPQTAALVVVACALIAIFSPLVFAAARLGILKLRFGDVHTQLVAATTVKHQISMYGELERQNAWSMTKLLSDIAVNTPIGVELESIRIEGGKDFSIGGTAIATEGKTPAQVVAHMQDNLRAPPGMFSDIIVNAGKSDNLGRYKFDLSAKVVRPYAQSKLSDELDFGRISYAERLYGAAARPAGSAPPTAMAGSDDESGEAPPEQVDQPQQVAGARSNPPRRGVENPEQPQVAPNEGETRVVVSAPGDSVAGDDPTARGDGMAVNPRAVPPPLDPEQIKVMSAAELKDALSKVGGARQNRDLDKETRDRLKAEWEMIMQQLRKVSES
jgi:hypothetical protein